MMTSPWSPTVNGCTECARREERSVGMPSLSKRLFTTTASARSQRRTWARPPSARGSRGSIGNRITFPRRVIGPSIIPLLATQPAGGTDGKVRVLRRNSEIGIVPRAPHAGPLVRHVYEQEHGRGGFAGKVTHTYHLYPPNNW